MTGAPGDQDVNMDNLSNFRINVPKSCCAFDRTISRAFPIMSWYEFRIYDMRHEGQTCTKCRLAGQIISNSFSFSPHTEFTPLIVASKLGFS